MITLLEPREPPHKVLAREAQRANGTSLSSEVSQAARFVQVKSTYRRCTRLCEPVESLYLEQ